MQPNRYSFLFLFLCFGALLGAQSDDSPALNPCGNTGVSPWLLWYKEHRAGLAAARSSETLYVPVTVHLVGSDNGTNYWPTENVFRVICDLNEQYADADVHFYLHPGDGIRFLPNSAWFEHDWSGGEDLINSNLEPGRLNAFVVGDPAGNCGYSWLDAIVLSKSCSGPGSTTWPHEAGHHFSLPHTFLGWEGVEDFDYSQPAPNDINWNEVERTDGSNCDQAGDFFCDTDPDYLSYRWNCNADNRSPVLQHDPAGVPFRSDGTLYMSYSDQDCRDRFSNEQILAIRDNLQFEHSDYLFTHAQTDPALLIDLPDDLTVQTVSPIDTALVQFNDFTLNWETVPNARYYLVEVALQASMVPKLATRTVIESSSVHLTVTLPKNRHIYWRVRAYNDWDVCQSYTNVPVSVFYSADLVATNELERRTTVELAPSLLAGGQDAVLTVRTDAALDAALIVLDATGRRVQQRAERLAAGETRLAIPTGALPPGVYVVTLQNQLGRVTRRLAVTE